ncbi:MAG TPA: hypothetical protein V6D19_10300, partial [Stenomitos sp.]
MDQKLKQECVVRLYSTLWLSIGSTSLLWMGQAWAQPVPRLLPLTPPSPLPSELLPEPEQLLNLPAPSPEPPAPDLN